MADPNTELDRAPHLPKAPSGQRGSLAKSRLPHGVVLHPDLREFLRNSALCFAGNDAALAHIIDANYKHSISGDPRMHVKHGIALSVHADHFSQKDAFRLAHGLVKARRHASPQSRDLYTAAIHHLGYRFDKRGQIYEVHNADFAAAMKNPAFRAYIAVDHYLTSVDGNLHNHEIGGQKGNTTSAASTPSAGEGAAGGIDRAGMSRGADENRFGVAVQRISLGGRLAPGP